MEFYILNDGSKIPKIGFGTYNEEFGDNKGAILQAIECGYRFFDTASLYETERSLGNAILVRLADKYGKSIQQNMKNAVCDGIIVSYCTGRAVPELLSEEKSFVRADQVSHMGDYNLQIYQSMFERFNGGFL